jgi:hypothetical protein
VVGAGRAVQEVPLSQRPLLTLDDGDALALKDEKRFLRRLRVVEAARLSGLEHREPHAELVEPLLGQVRPLPQHGRVGLEHAAGAEGRIRQPGRVADVDDEPALACGREPRADVFELRLLDHSRSLHARKAFRFPSSVFTGGG